MSATQETSGSGLSRLGNIYYKFGNFRKGFIFMKLRRWEVLVKVKPSRNGQITLLFTDVFVGKSCPSNEILTWQMSILTLFAKIKFLLEFPNLQYLCAQSPQILEKPCKS